MSADIVNLNKARKAKARTEKKAQAAENRVRFGQSKAERVKRDAETELADRRLDGIKRGLSPSDDPAGGGT